MLPRSNLIHRSAGEGDPRKSVRLPEPSSNGQAPLKSRMYWRLAMAALFTGLFVAFVFLNRGAVVEPRVHMLLARYDRPALLPVLLLTSLISIVGTLMVRGVLEARRRLNDARGRSLTALIELEASRIKHTSVPQSAPTA